MISNCVRKAQLVSLISWFVFVSSAWAISPAEFSAAVNISGRQRMLSQKMAKEFFLISLNEKVMTNKDALKETIKQFETALERLAKGDLKTKVPKPPNAEITGQVKKLQEAWHEYKKALQSEDLAGVVTHNMAVLSEANQLTSEYEKAAKKAGVKSAGAVVNIAGRQRMLSQRMAKEILMILKGIKVDEIKSSLRDNKALFDKSHKGLLSGDSDLGLPANSNSGIANQMNKVDVAWREFQFIVNKGMAGETIDKDDLSALSHGSNVLLNEMEQAVQMYQMESK